MLSLIQAPSRLLGKILTQECAPLPLGVGWECSKKEKAGRSQHGLFSAPTPGTFQHQPNHSPQAASVGRGRGAVSWWAGRFQGSIGPSHPSCSAKALQPVLLCPDTLNTLPLGDLGKPLPFSAHWFSVNTLQILTSMSFLSEISRPHLGLQHQQPSSLAYL